jgi:predicted phage terminase large subunit-like protein
MYRPLGAHPREANLEWQFPSGARVAFAHLEHDDSVYSWQGSQVPLLGFDELSHFNYSQFWYMMSRNRSTSGVPGYIRATTNPDADSWVRKLIDWWIGDDGYPIQKRSGVLRWFIRINDNLIWADSKEALIKTYGKEALPKSLTFVPSSIHDNKILMEKDPSYLASLRALSRVDRLRLEKGNWNVRATAGSYFQREWFPIVDAVPAGWIRAIRFWDRAATKPSEANPDPDWTRGMLVYKYADGRFCVADLKSAQDSPGQIETLIKNVAAHDGPYVQVMSQQDPGSAGVAEAEHFVRMLQGYNVTTATTSKDKETRAKPVSAQAEHHNILVYRAPWNEAMFNELENFPEGKHDDIVDVLSASFNTLCGSFSLLNAL